MSNKKILMIDDDAALLDMMQEFLQMEGYTFECLSVTADVVSLVADAQPDLVLVDYLLPGMTGGDLCRLLRDVPELKHLPVILLSAYPERLLPLVDLPISAFVPKPFDLWRLLACIHELLSLPVHTAA